LSKSRSGAPKRLAAGLLAGALAIFGLAFAPSAGATTDVKTDRYAGTNRYGTAAAIAGQDDFDGATTAILATGENFPDALAASGVAGANTPAPIILTQKATYTKEAHDALNAAASVTKVIIVGGTAAVSPAVENAVKADGFTVSRLAGTNRFGTAAAIAAASGTVGQVGGKNTALIANGLNYPDALAGGTVAYAAHLPILLVTPSSIPAETSKALDDLNIQHAIILGGTAAVSDAVKTQIDTATGSASERVAGTDRFGTAAAVGEWTVDNLHWAPTEIELASGVNFPDALAGGPLGGLRHAPILLLASVPDPTKKFADDHSDTIAKVNCLGGTAACAEADLQTVAAAAKNTGNDNGTANGTATTRPELVSASIKTVTAAFETDTTPAGTYVTYCFDEAVTGADPVAGDLWVYEADTTGTTADDASASAIDNKCVTGYFAGFDTVALASDITLGAVDDGAATDAGGNTNIEGDSALTPEGSSTDPSAAGVTSAPDLTAVSGFRAGFDADTSSVDFVFDEKAYTTPGMDGDGFFLVLTNGDVIQCFGPANADTDTPSGGTSPGGNGTTTITTTCDENGGDLVSGTSGEPTGAHFAASDIARGFVAQSVVQDSTGVSPNENPAEAADVSNSGNSSGPDLASAVFAPDAVADSDTVAYIFDEAVEPGTVPGPGGALFYTTASLFGIYDDTSNQVQANAFSCTRSTENNAIVLCFFNDGELSSASYVGANLDNGAVTDLQGIDGGGDEVAVAPSNGGVRTSGRTSGPDLTGVKINTVTSPLGSTTYTATYTFDEDTSNDSADYTSDGFHLYTPDGIQLDCNSDVDAAFGSAGTGDASTTLDNRSEDADNSVTCNSFVVASDSTAATASQIHSAVVGTVDDDVVLDQSGDDVNPIGAELTTGGNGSATA